MAVCDFSDKYPVYPSVYVCVCACVSICMTVGQSVSLSSYPSVICLLNIYSRILNILISSFCKAAHIHVYKRIHQDTLAMHREHPQTSAVSRKQVSLIYCIRINICQNVYLLASLRSMNISRAIKVVY